MSIAVEHKRSKLSAITKHNVILDAIASKHKLRLMTIPSGGES